MSLRCRSSCRCRAFRLVSRQRLVRDVCAACPIALPSGLTHRSRRPLLLGLVAVLGLGFPDAHPPPQQVATRGFAHQGPFQKQREDGNGASVVINLDFPAAQAVQQSWAEVAASKTTRGWLAEWPSGRWPDSCDGRLS